MSDSCVDRAREPSSRFFDLISTSAGLPLLFPLLLVLAGLILLSDGPPVFFSQMRVGKRGKLFHIWKFRTMRAGSEGSAVTAAGDSRVTRIGAILRRTKLDELPQLWNVLAGDMSLVGPRPEVPEFVQMESPIWQAVLQVRPGVTDLATLLFRNEEQLLAAAADPSAFYRETVLPVKLAWNIAYLRSRSFWRDLKLICLTIRFSISPRGFDPNVIKRAVGARATS